MNVQTPVDDVRQLHFDRFSSSESLAQGVRTGAQAQLPGLSDRRHQLASLRERVLCGCVSIYREPGAAPLVHRIRATRRALHHLGGRSAIRIFPAASRATGCASTRRSTPSHASSRHHARPSAGWMPWASIITCLFPTPMLSFGLHPQVEVEVALSRAYNRWLCERVLPKSRA